MVSGGQERTNFIVVVEVGAESRPLKGYNADHGVSKRYVV